MLPITSLMALSNLQPEPKQEDGQLQVTKRLDGSVFFRANYVFCLQTHVAFQFVQFSLALASAASNGV